MWTVVDTKKDSDGYEHLVMQQSELKSCVPSSIYMVECIKKKQTMKGGEDRILYISNQFDGHQDGTSDANMLATLQAIGLRVTSSVHGNAVKLEPGRAYLDSPAIVTVAWWGVDAYHAVVARWFTDDQSKVVFLDPAWGDIFEQVNDGYYTDGYGKGTIIDIYYF
jgi:Papain-like cysteine protease AvrRpt2